MKPQLYEQLAEVEDRHWWHQSRAQLLDGHVQRLGLGPAATIVDVGCGTGGTTRCLERYGRVIGIERCAQALAHARRKVQRAHLVRADARCLDQLVAPASVDLVTFMGVLYHQWIDDEVSMLQRVRRVLKPGGFVLLSEPACKLLTRRHDVVDLGRTRYRLKDFRAYFAAAGLEYRSGRYFNLLAFPACLLLAAGHRLGLGRQSAEHAPREVALPRPWINGLLKRCMDVERLLSGAVRCPLGVTLMTVGRKPSLGGG